MRLSIDFETRSKCILVGKTGRGLYAYAEDPTTDVFCCAVKRDDEKPAVWIGPSFRHWLKGKDHGLEEITDSEFLHLIEKADEIHAFNAQFERVIYKEVLQKRFGFPELPFEIWRCTAAKAAYFSLPRSLGNACEAIDLSQQKDKAGGKIMMKMTNPNKRTGKWHEDPDDFISLLQYCVQDVEAEYELDQALPEIPKEEIRMYHLDQKINDRGIYVDLEAVNNLIWKVEEKERRLMLQIQELTRGRITSTRQIDATKQWLSEQGVELDNLQRETVKDALAKGEVPFVVEQLLNTRQALAKASVAKLNTMKRWACKDSRIRGTLHFYGANTGRWAGRGIQPQNYPRDSFKEEDILNVLELGVTEVDAKYECTMQAASKCLRGMLCAAPGKQLVCADFSAIEARVLAWLAGEEKALKAFREGLDLYVVTASSIYRRPYEAITKEQRLIGKVAVLALGYQGWLGAFESMAGVYGVKIPEEQATDIIQKWRAANNKIVEFWYGVQEAALQAVKTEKVFSYGRIKYGIRGRFLHCRLPSGRLLSYCDPGTEVIKTKYGVEKEVVTFMGWDAVQNRWCKQYTYGGKLTENIVQAAARDLLRDALFRAETAGFNTVLHVHDEILTEEKASDPGRDFGTLESVMAEVPKWAEGCPIGAEGWEGQRYRK